MHALIIDDNLDNLDVLGGLLDTEGLTHSAVQNPLDLETTLQNLDHIDVVFLDLEMPDLDGFEVLDILKNDFRILAPIVAYTVHVSEVNVVYNSDFDGFLGKPLDPHRFPDQLQRILNGESVWEIP